MSDTSKPLTAKEEETYRQLHERVKAANLAKYTVLDAAMTDFAAALERAKGEITDAQDLRTVEYWERMHRNCMILINRSIDKLRPDAAPTASEPTKADA